MGNRALIWAALTLTACAPDAAPPAAAEPTVPALPMFHRPAATGVALPLAAGPGFEYRAVRVPGGPQPRSLQALSGEGRVLATAQAAGLELVLRGVEMPAALRVLADRDGPVALYANDPQDRDGDGVGRLLEQALGTCDAAEQAGCSETPLAGYYRSVGTADTDRDGLPDGEELFGVPGRGALDLPGWGADPRHKDVFVEVDHVKNLDVPVFYPQDMLELARIYGEGSAADLRNPDGRDGVRLHLDVGFEPASAEHAALYGDWGGATRVFGGAFKRGPKRRMARNRVGRFRYALAKRFGSGQSRGDGLYFNRLRSRVALFAHELGHTVGLKHHGHDSWGKANCKPQYVSIMNYLYQHEPRLGFSRARGKVLNPQQLLETEPPGPREQLAWSQPPLSLDVSATAVDWNRDGRISAEPVRAALGWGTYKSCGERAQGRKELWTGPALDATPSLISRGERLQAYWIDAEGRVLWTRQRTPAGDWEPAAALPLPSPSRRLVALGDDESGPATLLRTLQDGQLQLVTLDGVGQLVAETPVPGARSLEQPALLWTGGGAERRLLLAWRRRDGVLMGAVRPRDDQGWQVAPLRDAAGAAVVSATGPALLELPWGELCMAVAEQGRFIRILCRAAGKQRWTDLSRQAFYVGQGPRSEGALSLTYQPHQSSSGTATSPVPRGSLLLSFGAWEGGRQPNSPQLLLSEWLSAEHRAVHRLNFRWRGPLVDLWTTMAGASGVALLQQGTPARTRALMLLRGPGQETARLLYLPQADGAHDAQLSGGNDFQVMERGICLGLKGKARCGHRRTSFY